MPGAAALDLVLPAEAYRVLLVLCRVSAALMLLPGYGDGGVPVRIRIMAALGMALCVAPSLPAQPVPGIWGIAGAVVAESAVGIVLGTLSRIVIAAVQIAGQVIGQCIGVSNVFSGGMGFDSAATLGAAIQAGCVALIFAGGIHHAALRALAESYGRFPPGALPEIDRTAGLVTQAVGEAFRLSLQLSLPFLLLALLFNLALAGINRALPMVPVFMIGAPALLLAGLHLLSAAVPGLLGEAMGAYAALFQP